VINVKICQINLKMSSVVCLISKAKKIFTWVTSIPLASCPELAKMGRVGIQ
jgi:hypothetical protein